MKIKELNTERTRRIYLVWEIPIVPGKGLINLRGICSKMKLANLYKTMLERDLPSVIKKDASIFVEKSLLNHLFAYDMIDTITRKILAKYKKD